MDVKKCDRCGAIYNPCEKKERINLLIFKKVTEPKGIDLCHDCTLKFEKFMSNRSN